MEMGLMVKDNVTGSNKSQRQRTAARDGEARTKMGSESEADVEGRGEKWNPSGWRSDRK